MSPPPQSTYMNQEAQARKPTMLTVVAITGGIISIALLLFLTRRICDSILTLRSTSQSTPLPTHSQPQPPHARHGLRPSTLDSLSGFFIIPIVTAALSWTRNRLLRRYNNRYRPRGQRASWRSVESERRLMLERGHSTVSLPGIPSPAPAYLASHHTRDLGVPAYRSYG